MTTLKPIVCLGIMVADLLGGPLPSLPERGKLVLVEEMGLYPGGCAVNTSSALARLGLPVYLIGKVGRDPLGDFLIAALNARGVDTTCVKRDGGWGTSATMVMNDPDGERRFVHYIGANGSLVAEDIDRGHLLGSAILHLAGALVLPGLDGQPAADLLQWARSQGIITFLDTSWDASNQWLALLRPSLPHIDYMVPSLVEAQAITGREDPLEVAWALQDLGVGVVALKMGAAGCLVMAADGRHIRLPAYAVEVKDATGAGDAFAAGFIAGIYLGWSLDETARLANALGAMCVTDRGALGGISTLEETIAFMTHNPVYAHDNEPAA